jgi:hypothetical protein
VRASIREERAAAMAASRGPAMNADLLDGDDVAIAQKRRIKFLAAMARRDALAAEAAAEAHAQSHRSARH